MRPTIFDTFAEIVVALSKRSTCSSRVAVGALLFDSYNHIISTGYNGVPYGYDHCDDFKCRLDSDGHCKDAIHAEENALLQCAIVGRSTIGLRLFTTHSPCWKCALRLVQARIIEVTYIEPYGNETKQVAQLFYEYSIAYSQYNDRFEVLCKSKND